MKKEAVAVEMKKINIQRVEITLVGDSPLIVHNWAEKSKKEMLDKQMKKAKTAKAAKSPEDDYKAAFYRLPDGRAGFPVIAFKAAAVAAGGRFSDGMKMTELRGAFHIEGEGVDRVSNHDLVAIDGDPSMREDCVRVGMGTADLRYRPEFRQWRVTLRIRYNADAVSLDQIVNIFNLAGFGVGVGEWRPERDGQFGMFHVAVDGE